MSVQDRLDKIMQEEIDDGRAIGSVLLVYKDNKEIARGAYGLDSPFNQKPMTDNAIFRMFSMTKPVTSLAVMICLEKGLFKTTDLVEDYLPGFKNMTVLLPDGGTEPARRPITIADCLSMTAGLEYPNDFTEAGKILDKKLFGPIQEKYPETMVPTVELMNRCGEFPLLYQPGEKWNYSLCADVLGAVVEVASGVKYSAFLKENIFEPLGMKDTGFFVPEDKLDRYVTMHDKHYLTGEITVWDEPFLGTMSRKYVPAFESGGAGLVSTPDDYAKFALLLTNDGELPAEFSPSGKPVRLISKETAHFMRSPQLTPSQQETANWESLEGYNYGNLMRILEDTEKAKLHGPALGEFGWDGWGGTYVSIDPVNKITFMYFINVTNGNREGQMKLLKNALYNELGIN